MTNTIENSLLTQHEFLTLNDFINYIHTTKSESKIYFVVILFFLKDLFDVK